MDPKVLDKLNDFFGNSRIRTYAPGRPIIHADEDPEGIAQLLEGSVEQYTITPEGNTITVNMFKPPAFFPMSWAINKTPNNYFYGAQTEVKLRLANAEDTVIFLKANPDVMFDLLSRVYKGTDALLRRHTLLARGIASNRVIFEILIESYRFGTPLDDNKTLIKIKQAKLAARCGLARETVSRELHKLEKDNLLVFSPQGIIVNTPALEEELNINI